MTRIARYLPILERARSYDRGVLTSDLVAAAIVTIMLIPQALLERVGLDWKVTTEQLVAPYPMRRVSTPKEVAAWWSSSPATPVLMSAATSSASMAGTPPEPPVPCHTNG
jgi:hypothetical protein